MLADAPTGYVTRLQVYTGKGLDCCISNVGLCTRVVLDLMEDFNHIGVSSRRSLTIPFNIKKSIDVLSSSILHDSWNYY